MFNYHPLIKIFCVAVVCGFASHMHYLMSNGMDMGLVISNFLVYKLGAIAYVLVILFYADYHWQQKYYLLFTAWLLLNLVIVANALQYFSEVTPAWYFHYAQTTMMVVYSGLLLFVKHKFPNWLRIFSLANLLALIPCIWFFWAKFWEGYESLVYVLCYMPMLKSMVFIKREFVLDEEVVDN